MNQLIPFDQAKAIELFKNPKDMQELLDEIEKQAKDFEPDPTTTAGRKKIGSQAAMVSSSKVVIDKAKKVLTSDWAKKKKEVDALGKMAVDFCDRVRDEILDVRVKWQAKEDEMAAAAALKAEMEADELDAYERDELFDGLAKIKAHEKKLEAERIEKERIEAERVAEKERKANEERIRQEAEDKAKQGAAAALEAERENTARLTREAQEAAEKAEQARIVAGEREQARIKQAKADKQEAVKREQRRAKKEADELERKRLRRIEDEKREAQQRAADQENRRNVNNAIVDALVSNGVAQRSARTVVKLVATGKIPSISIRY